MLPCSFSYFERKATAQAMSLASTTGEKVDSIIFISHRSTDKDVADMLVDFFCGTGIPRNAVFCSSLPGNDINEKISGEVKAALKSSAINVAILSHSYYESAYCLNEAGVLWYRDDVPVIPIALPEITSNNMFGFLNNEYKLRCLDSDDDISYIYDAVSEAVSAPQTKHSIITRENQKLRERYVAFLGTREIQIPVPTTTPAISTAEITTDDERIVLYYILKKNVRKVSKAAIYDWLNKSEIYDVDIDNAFDLLSSLAGGTVEKDTLEFGIEAFRKYSANAASVLPELKECVVRHTKLAINTFKAIWSTDTLDPTIGLFIAYIIDKRMSTFGDRWKADGQIASIKQWESKNTLDDTLSKNYGTKLTSGDIMRISNSQIHSLSAEAYRALRLILNNSGIPTSVISLLTKHTMLLQKHIKRSSHISSRNLPSDLPQHRNVQTIRTYLRFFAILPTSWISRPLLKSENLSPCDV